MGIVQAGATLTVRHGARSAEVPAASLADDAPIYDRPMRRPDWLDGLWRRRPGISMAIQPTSS